MDDLGGIHEDKIQRVIEDLLRDQLECPLLLPRDDFSLGEIGDAYQLRWQVELLFKELKSYASLHRSNTGNPHLPLVERLIWTSVAAAVLMSLRDYG